MTVIYHDTDVLISHKAYHCRKRGGRLYRAFILDQGDLPVVRYDETTRKFEEVVNPRGLAYAARNRLKYRTVSKAR